MRGLLRPRPILRKGTAAVEAAVVLPVFLFFVFSLMEFGHAQLVAHMVRVACRTAARHGSTEGATTAQVQAKVLEVLAPVVPPQHIRLIVKDASIYDEVPLPESADDLASLPDIEVSTAEPRQFDGLSGTTGTFKGTGSYNGKKIVKCWVKSGSNDSGEGPGYGERFDDTNTAVKNAFGLNSVAYPYPHGSWDGFINYCRNSTAVRDAGYRKKYGGLTLMDYLMEDQEQHASTPDLWKTPHYPFHAVKDGCTLFLDFIRELDFGDQVGLVTYSTEAREETTLNEDGFNIDISADPITDDYDALDAIQRHKQAGHYSNTTAMGDGVQFAKQMLIDHMRYGARPTILLMTDGLANEHPGSFTGLPAGWNWADLTDYDGDGDADYTTTDINKQYAFHRAKQAMDRGFTVHTLAVGASADTPLLQALAFAGQGVAIDVPGGSTVAQMREDILEAFNQIAGKVPPPKLIYTDGAPQP